MPPADPEAIAAEVFVALADPDPAELTNAGLTRAERGERRRVRNRLQPGPMAVAQSYLDRS